MISVEQVRDIVEKKTEGTGIFIIDILVHTGNKIEVFLDHPQHLSINQCISVSRAVESSFDREQEDFELMVSSAGAEAPFKVLAQYQKFAGKKVEVTDLDGNKVEGLLINVGNEGFEIEQTTKERIDAKKKKQEVKTVLAFQYDKIKHTKSILSFN
jgi:ribosome maturation factor RimP